MRKLFPLTEENLGLLDNKPAEKVRKIFPELPLNDDEDSDSWQLHEDDAKKYYRAYNFAPFAVFCGCDIFLPLEENVKVGYLRFEPYAMALNELYQLGDVQVGKDDVAAINRNMPIDDNMYLPVMYDEDLEVLPVFSDQGRILICNAALSERAGGGNVNVAFTENDGFHKICFLRGGLCGLSGQF